MIIDDYTYVLCYNKCMSDKAEKIIKEVNATMSLEGMPLSELDIELFGKIIDGELTREEAFKIFKKESGLNV